MRNDNNAGLLGRLVGGCSALGYLGFGLISIVLNMWVVLEATDANFFVLVLAFIFFPATMIAAPWYALLVWGNLIPLIVTYGGFIVMAVLYTLFGRD